MRKKAKNCKLRRKNCKLHIKENPGRKLLGNKRKKRKMQKKKKHCFCNIKRRKIQNVYAKKGEKNCKLRRKNVKLHIRKNPGRKLLGSMQKKRKMQKNIDLIM